MIQILICDDEPPRLEEWTEAVSQLQLPDTLVTPLEPDALIPAIEALEARRVAARRRPMEVEPESATPFDTADIVIIDQDLLGLGDDDDQQLGSVSGDDLAYLVRCYSSAGVIVLMNREGENRFDLRLMPDLDIFADVEIGSRHLGLPGLWRGWSEPEFRPWAWPILLEMVNEHANRAREIDLAAPVLESLALTPERMSRDYLEFFGGEAEAFAATFGDVARSGPSGLRRKDEPMNEAMLRNIAAARVHRWLDGYVRAGQDVLVDAPHLVSRFPSLLVGDPGDLGTWNRAAHVPELGDTISDVAEASEYPHRSWLSRRAWYWTDLARNEAIAEVREPWEASQGEQLAFCEDVSAFVERSQARPFVAAVPSPFVRRFVVDRTVSGPYANAVEGIDYAPADRFSG